MRYIVEPKVLEEILAEGLWVKEKIELHFPMNMRNEWGVNATGG